MARQLLTFGNCKLHIMLKKRFLLLLLPLFAFVAIHKYYVSVTSVKYSDKEHTLQITSRVFIDDFDELLKQRYGIKSNLATKNENPLAEDYIKKYVKQKFHIYVNGEEVEITYLGKEYDTDNMVLYLEVQNIYDKDLKTVEVESTVLTDIYEEQKNIVHLKFLKNKKSVVLTRVNNKGMLKF
ncbi:hypothetical protein KLA_12824 [Cellulophaga geojensis KL-A]|uniref:Peptidase E n=3 Tax=Flavobacteriaceae TaxID=49546 RepID=F0RAP4_CELLC|nr:hypothetical protein Celly_0602 [Cellulophaga lytica DSM 7489]APU09306.1 hypothetical protein A5M85_03100 [Cellulophaga lytica]EWH12867.1 hypothetical protein KLA_12824 [Cellulophaga geojensis KL-A]SNQ44072.1 Conserved hypothetical periplasmic protein [Cellulophaga lytica]